MELIAYYSGPNYEFQRILEQGERELEAGRFSQEWVELSYNALRINNERKLFTGEERVGGEEGRGSQPCEL